MQSPSDNPEIVKIATLKNAQATERLNQHIAQEQRQKKAELASRGLSQGGAFIKAMHELNVKRLEGMVYGCYTAWKEALSETGHVVTAEHLKRVSRRVRPAS